MAVALTSFIQPMLIGNHSSNSSLQVSHGEQDDLMAKDVCPSPSASPSPSLSPSPSASHNHIISISQISQTPSTSVTSNELLNDKTSTIDNYKVTKTKTKTKTKVGTGEVNNTSDSELSLSTSLSTSQCRYCYSDILRKSSVSQCHCSGVLCKQCLINELKLTHGRADSLLQCTVCKNEYDVRTEFKFSLREDCNPFCIDSLIHCGLKDEQYLLDSVGGKIGFFLVILGINTWILSTSLLFAFPPNGCPIELYYMVSVFDFAVGVSTIWFIIKCRYLSPAFLCIMYFVRCLYVLCGWIPSINFCNIYIYHAYNKNHISILSYFTVFSFIASIVMAICWIIDLKKQYKKYKKENGKLILSLNTNDIKIEINDIVIQHAHS